MAPKDICTPSILTTRTLDLCPWVRFLLLAAPFRVLAPLSLLLLTIPQFRSASEQQKRNKRNKCKKSYSDKGQEDEESAERSQTSQTSQTSPFLVSIFEPGNPKGIFVVVFNVYFRAPILHAPVLRPKQIIVAQQITSPIASAALFK